MYSSKTETTSVKMIIFLHLQGFEIHWQENNTKSMMPLLISSSVSIARVRSVKEIREFKKTTTATATGTSLNKRFNEQNNRCARAL